MEVTGFFSEVAPGVGPEPPLKKVYEAGPKADAVICQGGLQRKKQMKYNTQYYPIPVFSDYAILNIIVLFLTISVGEAIIIIR